MVQVRFDPMWARTASIRMAWLVGEELKPMASMAEHMIWIVAVLLQVWRLFFPLAPCAPFPLVLFPRGIKEEAFALLRSLYVPGNDT